MRRSAIAFFAIASLCAAGSAYALEPRQGWIILDTQKPYKALVSAVKAATKAAKFGVVTEAGPTGAAKARGITIPGNRVIGVFRNDYAVEVLKTSTEAMIEAPIRFYVTENADGSATLSYKKPSFVFAPYMDEGGQRLVELSKELDTIFRGIADDATKP